MIIKSISIKSRIGQSCSTDLIKSILLIALLLISVIQCLELSLDSPNGDDTWHTKDKVQVSWKIDKDDSEISQMDIDLVQGPEENIVSNISFGVPKGITTADWVVADTLLSGDDYQIRITCVENPKFKYLGPKFKISQNVSGMSSKNPAVKPMPNFNVPIYAYLGMFALAVLF